MLTLEHTQYLRNIDGDLMAVVNAVILIAVTTPLIYLFVVKPSVDSRDKELRHKAHLLSETQRIAHIGGWELESTGRLSWSDEMFRVFRVSRDTFMPDLEFFIGLIHPDDRAAVRNWLDSCRVEKRCVPLEFRSLLPDGSVDFISACGEMKYAPGSNLTQLVGTAQNITARTQAENQLNLFFDLSQDMLCIASADGYFKRVNPAFTRILGWSTEEMLMRPYLDFLHPDDHAAALREVEKQVVEGERTEQFETRFQHKDSTWRLLSWESSPGEGGLMFATARDITESKQAELLVARSVKELADFKAALDQHAIVAVTDVRGIITYANDKFCAISKYSREELIGQSHRIINSGYHTKDFFRELWKTISNGQVWQGEFRNRAKDGMLYWVSTTIVPFLDDLGKPVQYIAIRTDISAREAAERANRAKDSFLAMMSHEIRTPLGGMIGMLELLGYTPLNEDQRDTLQTAMDSSQSLLRIVNDILDWSKIEAGKLELAPRVTSITRLVAGVVSTYARVASAHSLVLEQEVDGHISLGHIVDPLRLAQVLNNFVSNAIKFTPKGKVMVRAELLGQQGNTEKIRFSVRDTGIGIEPEVQKRLFQLYSQESADTARMYGGTGLGLAICRSLAIMMNGYIELESTPGRGSTFSITLNLPVSVAAVEQASRVPIEGRTFFPDRKFSVAKTDAPVVLVVDDDPINRKLMSIQIGLLGFRTECVENGEAALARWRNGSYALVITDCHMPKMDGYELARALRKIEASGKEAGKSETSATKTTETETRKSGTDATDTSTTVLRTPIFGWSANALSEEVERCLDAGMDELLVKPVGLTQLKEILSRWLGGVAPAQPAHIALRNADNTQAAPINFSALDELSDNAVDKAEILLDFMAQTRSDLAELEVAVAMSDFQLSMRIAHRMKGASRMVGARAMATACEAMELAVRQGKSASVDNVKAALVQLEYHLAKVNGKNQEKETGNG